MRSYRTTSVARNYQKPIIEENKPVSQGKCRALLTLNETSNYLLSQPDAHPLSISVAVAPFKDTNCKIKCKTFMKWQLFISHSLKSKWYYTCLCVYLKFFFIKKDCKVWFYVINIWQLTLPHPLIQSLCVRYKACFQCGFYICDNLYQLCNTICKTQSGQSVYYIC